MERTRKKSNMNILNEIRDYRNQELVENKDNRVFYTRVMPLEIGEKTGKQIYRIIEEYSKGENLSQIRELFYEYDEKEGPKLIALIDPEIYEGILRVGEPEISEEEQKEWELTLDDIIEGREKNKENLYDFALLLGIDENEVKGLTEVELYKKIDEKTEEKDKDVNDEKNKDVEKTISNQEAKKRGIIGMNTISLNQKVGVHGETLKSEIGLDKREEYSDIDEIEIIPSYKLAYLGEKVLNVPFVAAGKRPDGELVVFPESVCKPYKGENNEITKLDGKNDKITRERSTCMFEFSGKNTSLAIDQKSPYGIVDASLAYNTRDNDGRVALDLQNKYEDGIRQQDIESRKAINMRQGVYHADEMVEEAKEHPEGEKLNLEEVDGDKNTGHKHYNPENEEHQKAIEDIMNKGKVSKQEAEIKFNIELEKNENLSIEQATENAIEEIENEYRGRNIKR